VRTSALLLGFLLLAGCPDSKGTGDAADVNSGVPTTGKIPKKPKEAAPVEAAKPDAFPHDVLVELYKADQLGDDAIKRKHGLVGPDSKEIPAKRDAYEAALRRFAEEHPDELSKLADEIEAARVTTPKPADVKEK
jgi:hypothetical protein